MDVFKELDIKIEEAISFPGLTVVPVYSSKNSQANINKVFGEALGDGSLKIKELPNSSVPKLNMEYSGEGYVLGIKGNLIVGGGQDRQLYHSCVVAKGSYQIPVQCVQKGRWNPAQNKDFTQSKSLTSSGLRFNTQSQQETWSKITSYETLTNTRSGTESFTHTQSLTMAGGEEYANILKKQNMSVTDKQKNVRERAQNMLQGLKEHKVNQVGFLAIQVNPFAWMQEKKTKTNYLLEVAGNPEIWKKLHMKAMESLIYDTAICEMDQIFTVEIDKQAQAEIAQFLALLNVEEWNEAEDYIGQENRFQLKKDNFFGEAIYLGDDVMPIHMIASTSSSI